MKLFPLLIKILITMTAALIFLSPVSAMDDPGFTISRMVICDSISDREPNGIADTFSTEVKSVYCFLEAKNIEFDTEISFVWYLEGQEKAKVSVPLQKGRRWRTYSSKKIANMKGNWKVELQEASGIILNSVFFQVE